MASMSRRSFLQLFGASAAAVAGLGLVGCGGSSNSGSSDSKVETIKSRGKLKCGVKKDVVGYGLLNTSTNTYEGMEIDLCYQVAAKVFGCSYDEAKSKDLCEFTDVTPKTRGPLIDNDQLDLICATYTITDDRKKSWDFTDPYRTDHVGILIKKGSMSSMADLDGKHIGVSQGSTTKDAITKMLADNGFSVTPQFDEYPDYPSINSALDAGQIDAFAMDRSTLKTYTTDDKELLQPEIEFGAQDYGIATKKGCDLSEVTEAVVKDVTSNGWIDEEIKTWGLL
ncbi:MAG: transporter substrate-binding domain-containing protein [Atopobiaceae bacterium]|jgi:putative glutamine transport system substrate-binding protein|uniref:transporter substrate-binding domain-containing protein n=1 Tax=Paratractidigestivibacter sp. TaxID=2847316 RepID=UPI003A90E8FF|nr:transporter substrate-binding domain-containing protein [Atopobiaceae bacterium]